MSRLTPQQIQLMKDELTCEIAVMLVEETHCTTTEALDTIYTSETFERLQDNNTGLYYQSAGYVYSFLKNELLTARVS